jgi:hypothetical protein
MKSITQHFKSENSLHISIPAGPSIAIVDDGYAATPLGLKCLKKKKNWKKSFILDFKFVRTHAKPSLTTAMLQSRQDWNVSKEKKKKKFLEKIPNLAGPTPSHRWQRLCCNLAGIEMFQGKKKI